MTPTDRTAALVAYQSAVDSGHSTLIRPSAAYDGLDAVIRHVAGLSGAPLVVTDLAGLPSPARPLPCAQESPSLQHRAEEPLVAFHTSGSTGRPKCVIYRRSVVDAHARTIAQRLRLTEEAATWVALPPPGFAYGLSILHSHTAVGVPVTFVKPEWGLPDLPGKPGLRGDDDPLAVYVLPQHVPLLLSAGIPEGRLRHVLVAGGRLSGASARMLAERFPGLRLTNMYGQAELGPRLATWSGPAADFVEGTIGTPLPGVELQVQDGELHARTPYAMEHYVPAPYDEMLPGPGADSVATRDRGTALPDGTLRHEGRADHVLNVAGTKVDGGHLAALVEREFAPLVVRVTSRPARVGGDMIPIVEIVPGDTPVTRGAVRRVLHTEIGAIAGLCTIEIVDELHLTESGK